LQANADNGAIAVADAGKSKASGSSFYAGMRLLPKPQREAMYAIYGFCRAVDDIADAAQGARAERRAELDAWRGDIEAIYAGRPSLGAGFLVDLVNRYGLRKEDFLAVIDGMEMDAVEDIRAPSLETLDLYCDRVASAVGRLSVRAFGLVDDGGNELPTGPKLLAYHLGRALQLTNILRDLDEDAARGRLYLPREALNEAGVANHAPHAALASPAIGEACALVLQRARAHFEQSDLVMAGLPKSAVKAPYLMAAGYRSILDGLSTRGFAPPRAPVRMSRVKLIGALLRHAFL
jgi:squalene synthase HpnD